VNAARPYLVLSEEKSVVECNPDESVVYLPVSVNAFPVGWTMQWFKDGELIAADNPRFTATYVLTVLVHYKPIM